MGWEILVVAEGEQWLGQQDRQSFQQIVAAPDLLAQDGPALHRPLADTVRGSRHKNMKELRPGSAGRSEIRILFAFDPDRKAVLLVAGDKAGNWTRWYDENIGLADDRYDKHLAERASSAERKTRSQPRNKR